MFVKQNHKYKFSHFLLFLLINSKDRNLVDSIPIFKILFVYLKQASKAEVA